MKKFICVLLAVMLTLGVSVSARGEVCPTCQSGTLRTKTVKEYETVPCEITGDPDMEDTVIYTYRVEMCGECGYEESRTLVSTDHRCPH